MTSDLDTGGEPPIELRRRRTFRVRLWIGVAVFLLANVALDQWGANSASAWHVVLAIMPLVPVVWIVIVVILRARQYDEYQLKLFFPGLAVGFSVAMVTGITLGTLSAAGFAVPNGGWAVCIAGLLSWEFTNLLIGAPKA